MCLIVFAWKVVPGCPLFLIANRDEFYARPTQQADWWQDYPDVYAGRDLQAGGTWLGINRRSRFAALTNVRDGLAKLTNAPSRGELVARYLQGELNAESYLQELTAYASQYQGFNLILGDESQIYWFSNHGNITTRALPPGIYGLSNAALDTPWPKVVRAKAQFASLLCQSAPDAAYFEMLADTATAPDHLLPQTGVSLDWERLLSSVCIEAPDYGTRASSLLRLTEQTGATLIEQCLH